jgi:DNA-binding transcriptional LysR family regulator
MRLQQLRYLIAVAENGSMNSAAQALYVSQSSLSVAVKELEQEMGVTIFRRSNKGIELTSEGVELLGYARQVVEQADLMLRHYVGHDADHQRLSISTQHYAFAVDAFIDFVHNHDEASFDFHLRETRTTEIFDDVRTFRSDLGIIYLSNFNESVLRKRLADDNLVFTSLFKVKPHVFVREGHPLASEKRIRPDQLADYPRYAFEQGADSSLYYSEEPLASLPCSRNIYATDRGTLTGLLTNYDGYLVSSGVRSREMQGNVVSVPLVTDEIMDVGYIIHRERRLSSLAREYIEKLYEQIFGFDGQIEPSKAAIAYHDGKR